VALNVTKLRSDNFAADTSRDSKSGAPGREGRRPLAVINDLDDWTGLL